MDNIEIVKNNMANDLLKERYEKWIYEFMKSWKNLDWKKTLSLMDKNVRYYENPIDEPCKTFRDVEKLWSVVEFNQKDISYSFEVILCSSEYCIVNWQMNRTFIPTSSNQIIDGIFQISLNDDDLCTLFKQWRFTR